MENKVSKLFDEMQNILNDSQHDVNKFCEGNKGNLINSAVDTQKMVRPGSDKP